MKKDKNKTRVIFRMTKETENTSSECIAFFPDSENANPDYIGSYMHVGQHSDAHIDFMKECKTAKYIDWRPLYNELSGLGYNMSVISIDHI